MLSLIINYLLLATLVTWFLDYIANKVSSKEYQFNWWEKIVIWIGWPIFVVTFIVMFISTFFKNNE